MGWKAIIVIFVSQLISSVAMFFNSRCASIYQIGYPVVARGVFGLWSSFYVHCGVALPFPGFIGTLGVRVKSPAAHLGDLVWILSIMVTFLVYVATCMISPTSSRKAVKEMGYGWEYATGDGFIAPNGTIIAERGDVVIGMDPAESIEQTP